MQCHYPLQRSKDFLVTIDLLSGTDLPCPETIKIVIRFVSNQKIEQI